MHGPWTRDGFDASKHNGYLVEQRMWREQQLRQQADKRRLAEAFLRLQVSCSTVMTRLIFRNCNYFPLVRAGSGACPGPVHGAAAGGGERAGDRLGGRHTPLIPRHGGRRGLVI